MIWKRDIETYRQVSEFKSILFLLLNSKHPLEVYYWFAAIRLTTQILKSRIYILMKNECSRENQSKVNLF